MPAMMPAQFVADFPECRDYPVASNQLFPRGAVVTWNTSNQRLQEHALGTTVTNVLGVSMEGCVSTGVSSNPSGNIGVALASRNNTFVSRVVNNAGVIQQVSPALIGNAYGILKVGSGLDAFFAVNQQNTANTLVRVTGIDQDRNIVFFKFLESAIQVP